jgi:hypothetical protein
MKKLKITYWVTTAIVGFMMTFSAYAYFTDEAVKQGFTHLGYPGYFRIELAVAKLLGAAVLLVPFSSRVKEWAYAGFAITFISAIIAHTVSGDPGSAIAAPAIFLILLSVSYITYHRSRDINVYNVNRQTQLAA